MKRQSLCLFLALFAFARCANSSATVWIDTDVSIGSPFREVDDAFALLLAFRSPELRIAGLSTTYGNASLTRSTAVARELARQFGHAARVSAEDVYSGASSAEDLGRSTEATAALVRRLEAGEKITYIALGPLTNLATFLRLHPQLSTRIERIYFVGGKTAGATLGFGPSERFRIHDANVFKDPAAVRAVIASGIPISLAPIEVSSRFIVSGTDRERLRACGSAGRYLADRIVLWLWFWTAYVHADGGPVFDALPMIAVVSPAMVEQEKRFVTVSAAGDLIASKTGARAVQWCGRFEKRAHEMMLRRLCDRRR